MNFLQGPPNNPDSKLRYMGIAKFIGPFKFVFDSGSFMHQVREIFVNESTPFLECPVSFHLLGSDHVRMEKALFTFKGFTRSEVEGTIIIPDDKHIRTYEGFVKTKPYLLELCYDELKGKIDYV